MKGLRSKRVGVVALQMLCIRSWLQSLRNIFLKRPLYSGFVYEI